MTVCNAPTKVVVIGGGYAETMAANHLRMRRDIDIWFTGRPRSTQPAFARCRSRKGDLQPLEYFYRGVVRCLGSQAGVPSSH